MGYYTTFTRLMRAGIVLLIIQASALSGWGVDLSPSPETAKFDPETLEPDPFHSKP